MSEMLALFAQTSMPGDGSAPAGTMAILHYLPWIAAGVGGVGIWLMLPPGNWRRQMVGGVTAALGFGLLAFQLLRLGQANGQVLFWVVAALTVISAAATISMRSPVYSAIWFALMLLATAGLLMLQGAQFLSVATVIVYAGAILVTFLFVLMLAQSEGHAYYDRISWGPVAPACGALCGAMLVGGLTYTLTELRTDEIRSHPSQVTQDDRQENVLHPQHMVKFGGQLFSGHLLSVEIAGTLLLVALVGAVAIVIQSQESHEASEPTRRKADEGRVSHG